MVETKRKEGESFESLLRRFSRQVMQSGVLIQAKKVRFRQRAKSPTLTRRSAQHRTKVRTQLDYLRKIGKVDETTPRRRTRRS